MTHVLHLIFDPTFLTQMKYFAIISKDEVPIPDTLKHSDIAQILEMCLRKDRTKRATVAQLLAL